MVAVSRYKEMSGSPSPALSSLRRRQMEAAARYDPKVLAKAREDLLAFVNTHTGKPPSLPTLTTDTHTYQNTTRRTRS